MLEADDPRGPSAGFKLVGSAASINFLKCPWARRWIPPHFWDSVLTSSVTQRRKAITSTRDSEKYRVTSVICDSAMTWYVILSFCSWICKSVIYLVYSGSHKTSFLTSLSQLSSCFLYLPSKYCPCGQLMWGHCPCTGKFPPGQRSQSVARGPWHVWHELWQDWQRHPLESLKVCWGHCLMHCPSDTDTEAQRGTNVITTLFHYSISSILS